MQLFALTTAPEGASYWPFAVLVISVALIIVLITVLRIHAFLALILAAVTAGLLSSTGQLPGEYSTIPGNPAAGRSHWVQAIELTATEFGNTAGKIGIIIGLASIIGMCLMESGAADKVVRRFLAVFGEKRAGLALLLSTYLVSIPIFFDTLFMLLVPLAKSLRVRTGQNYVMYILAICCAGVITHSMLAPHPGPLAMAENLKLDVGMTILVGLATGLVPLFGGWVVIGWINRRVDVPLRETPGSPLADLQNIVTQPEYELPSFTLSILPVILPIVLMSLASVFVAVKSIKVDHPVLFTWVDFVGNRNMALLIGTVIAAAVLVRQKGITFKQLGDLLGPPLETAGVIILITSAGGAFGLMLKHAGVGGAIEGVARGHAINPVLLAWLVALVIRIAQGSATVAMLATSSMMFAIINTPPGIGCHPMYIFLAIGYGAIGCSWMNDSGFWVVSRLGGLTEKETLRSWTVLLTAISVLGLLTTLLLSMVLPLKAS